MDIKNSDKWLMQGDCLERMKGMETDSVDLVVTSPPYNLNKKASGGGNSKRNYDGWYPDDMPEEDYQLWQIECVSEMLRISKGGVYYNHKVRYAWHSRNKYRTPSNIYHPIHWLGGFPIWCEIIWDRRGTTGHSNRRCRISDERIYQIGKPCKFNDMGYTTVWQILPTKNKGHVCSYPEELVRRCILMSTDKGDIVFDPFMGSGTTGAVSLGLGRRFVGIELDSDFFNTSVDRIRQVEQDKSKALITPRKLRSVERKLRGSR